MDCLEKGYFLQEWSEFVPAILCFGKEKPTKPVKIYFNVLMKVSYIMHAYIRIYILAGIKFIDDYINADLIAYKNTMRSLNNKANKECYWYPVQIVWCKLLA